MRLPTPLVVAAQLTHSAPWSAALRDGAGEIVARTAGEGTTARLEWNGLRPPPGFSVDDAPGLVPALPGSYEWAVRVEDGRHPPDRRTGLVEVQVLGVD